MPRSLTFVPTGGLGNRIRSLDAALRLCQQSQTPLRVFWFRNWEMPCCFYDLWQHNTDTDIIDAHAWRHFLYDRPRKETLWIPKIWQNCAFRSTIYENQVPQLMQLKFDFHAWLKTTDGTCYMASYDAFLGQDQPSPLLENFTPSATVQQYIDDIKPRFSSRMVGIHIRRTDNRRAIETSPTHLFDQRIEQILAQHPDTRFFLATDSMLERNRMRQRFGDHRIITPPHHPARKNTTDTQQALAEMYLLAACDYVIGSYWSSFSKVAAQLGGKPFDLLH